MDRESGLSKEAISKTYRLSKERFGYRPIQAHLREKSFGYGRDRALRLTREIGIQDEQSNRYKPYGTDIPHDRGSLNLLKANRKPSTLDEVCLAATTYPKIDEQLLYSATVMDLFSRRIRGRSV